MPKFREKIGSPAPSNPDEDLRLLATRTMRACAKSREQIAEDMSATLGQRVSLHMLNGYTGEAKKVSRFPACFVAAFCEATGDDAVRMVLLSDRQRHLLGLGEQAEQLVLAASRERKRK